MCIHNQCFRAKKANFVTFHLKNKIFTAVKYCCILHGRACYYNRKCAILVLYDFDFSTTPMAFRWHQSTIHTTSCKCDKVWRGFLFLWVLGMGYVILLWHSLSLPYNYFLEYIDRVIIFIKFCHICMRLYL